MEYTVKEIQGKDLKAGEEYWLNNSWHELSQESIDKITELQSAKTWLVRVPSSPVMSFEEFCKKESLLESTDSAKDKYAGYLIGTRSIVPEMKDTICPFCLEQDFDRPGLKHHLENYCDVYKKTKGI